MSDTFPPVWADIQRAARHSAILQRAVTMADSHRHSREQALMSAAIALDAALRETQAKLVNLMMRQPFKVRT